MFAVPGWSISSESLKRQTKEIIDVEPGLGPVDREVDDETAGPSKKPRKRKRANGHLPVTKDNVAELWEKFIARAAEDDGDGAKSKLQQGTDPSKKGGGKRKKERKQIKKVKAGEDAADDSNSKPSKQSEKSERASSPSGDAEKSSKKRRRTKATKKDDRMDLLVSKDFRIDPPALASVEQQHPIDVSPAAPPPGHAQIQLTPLQASMRQKLTSARFRHLNQTLYTTSSTDSFQLFQENPEMFDEYHEGFQRQVAVWPENPVDKVILELERRAKIKDGRHRENKGKGKGNDRVDVVEKQPLQPLPRTDGICTIADLGCGDAKLARTMDISVKKMKLKIVSYDLYSANQHVNKADIANLPLKDGSVDVAIFCLALMGTNWIDFVEEAYRILRWKGELWISEIKSRFGKITKEKASSAPPKSSSKSKSGKARKALRQEDDEKEVDVTAEVDGQETGGQGVDTDVSAFVEVLRRRGFALDSDGTAVDSSNKMFVTMHFVKRLAPTKGKGVLVTRQGDPDKLRGEIGTHRQKTKFVEEDDNQDIDETAVLKPCVYKIR
ncbi:MAG: 25S rRNA (adenine645-N1)-methyltransferase [Peltula sp. TS41687]|nr:MAG: 25S rRNA (adenine645-N1)-methyltransferase [Peltula sp. TS41687]